MDLTADVLPQRDVCNAVAPIVKTRTYYAHVEGLRGVAAVYVFLYHIWQVGIAHSGSLSVLLPITLPWLQFGHFSVSVFIVISGFCLGLPVAQRIDHQFDPKAFAKSRARRLGPAYLLSLVLSIIVFFITAAVAEQHIVKWRVIVAIVSHVLLVHNLLPGFSRLLNGPMWSIALECQIYLIFALLLVPIWKRFGPFAQLGFAAFLGLAPHFVFHGHLDYIVPWLLTLFSMGLVAAHVTVHSSTLHPSARVVAFGASLLAIVAVSRFGEAAQTSQVWWADLVVGIAASLFFITSRGGSNQTFVARALSFPPIVKVGSFSYSLYLVHWPIIAFANAVLLRYSISSAGAAFIYVSLIPIVIIIAYKFFEIAERPFMSSSLRKALGIS